MGGLFQLLWWKDRISTIVFLDGSHSVYGICFSLNKAVSLYFGSLLNSCLCNAQNPLCGCHRDLQETSNMTILSHSTFFPAALRQLISPEVAKHHQREDIWSGPGRRTLAMLQRKRRKSQTLRVWFFFLFWFLFWGKKHFSIKSMEYWSTNPLEFIILVDLSLSFPWCP